MRRFLTDEEIGQRLREAREAKGLTQTELATMLGVGQSAVGKWERGVVRNIKRTMIQQIANALGISPVTIIGLVTETETKEDEARRKRIKAQNKRWNEEIGSELLTEEEFSELLNYAKFIISKRKG